MTKECPPHSKQLGTISRVRNGDDHVLSPAFTGFSDRHESQP